MTSALAAAARAFGEQLEELGLADPKTDLGDPRALGRRAALLAAADTLWRMRLELLTSEQAQTLLRVQTRQAVHELVKRRRLIAVPTDRGTGFPVFQFGPDGRPYRLIPDLLRIFEAATVKPHTLASWFLTEQALLENKTPAEWLRRDCDHARLLEAARRSAQRLAH
jgi:hypothetical protein